jgi:hypothetical protein
MLNTPVLSSSRPAQVLEFNDFVNRMRTGAVPIAQEESERLEPEFGALAQLLAEEGQALPEHYLSNLFNAVAADTRNLVLSEIMIIPETLLDKGGTQFNAEMSYDGHSFTFGFEQIFSADETSSVSLPHFAFNAGIMGAVRPYRPEVMLKEFQRLMTAGNHDWLHHYSNVILNSRISKTAGKHATPLHVWRSKNFPYGQDSNPQSYESWLMLEQARIRRTLEEGLEGKKLEKSCDRFFDELARIGREMAKARSVEEAHEAVDYFGTLLGFALMRYVPLNHPLFVQAIEGLREADPSSGVIEEKKDEIKLASTDALERTQRNYAAEGLKLWSRKPDYAMLKTLQIIGIAPWMARLLSPEQNEKSPLAQAQQRADKVGHEMIEAAVATARNEDGVYIFTEEDGGTKEWHIKNHQYHNDDGPACIEKGPDGKTIMEHWYRHGLRYRLIKYDPDETIDQWFDSEGNVNHGTYTFKDGSSHEYWHIDGKSHRTDGPCDVWTDEKGRCEREYWKCWGKPHREDGPACIERYREDGRYKYAEVWYRHGEGYTPSDQELQKWRESEDGRRFSGEEQKPRGDSRKSVKHKPVPKP